MSDPKVGDKVQRGEKGPRGTVVAVDSVIIVRWPTQCKGMGWVCYINYPLGSMG